MEQADSTSFASILAGVRRLREQQGDTSGTASSSNSLNLTPSNSSTQKRSLESSISNTNTQNTNTHNTNTHNTNNQNTNNQNTNTQNTNSQNSNNQSNTSNSHTQNARTVIYNSSNSKIISGSGKASKLALRHQQNSKTTFQAIQVSSTQKGNPLLKSITNVSWEYNNQLSVDYVINPKIQVLFLSLKYHRLHPEYVFTRFRKMQLSGSSESVDNNLKVLLCVVDIDNHDEILQDLNKICVNHDLTLILAWSFDEAGRYVQYLKQLELNNATGIKGIVKEDYQSRIVDTLTAINRVNKTDAINLIANYGSFKNLVNTASREGLENIQGFGSKKVESIESVFDQPFIFNREYDNDG